MIIYTYNLTIYVAAVDILLHQNGHIMLTDFDLSKGSHPPGNPGVVKSNSPNVVGIHYRIVSILFYAIH
jgi:hypothetical protein